MTALGHSLSAAGAAGSHRVFHHNSGRMTRRTLLDFFADVTGGAAAKRAPFLVYDDGYRTWTWTYAELAAAASTFGARLRAAGIHAGHAGGVWGGNPPGWVPRLVGAPPGRGRADPLAHPPPPDFLPNRARLL